MPFVEQIIYGVNEDEPAKGSHALAHSPGVNKDVAREVAKLCESWGSFPVLGLSYPALMAFPLDASLASLRGNLYAIIRVKPGQAPLFHGLIINDADYTVYGHNPYALASVFPFEKFWSPGQPLARTKLKPGTGNSMINPLPSPEDVGVVDLIVEQSLVNGRSILPLDEASEKSDRALALVIAALPKDVLRSLRFASFAMGPPTKFNLAASYTPGSTLAGWKRLLLTIIVGKVSPEHDSFVRKVRALLEVGDLDGLRAHDMQPQARNTTPASEPAPAPAMPEPKGVFASTGAVTKNQSAVIVRKTDNKPSGVRRPKTVSRVATSKRGDMNFSRFLMLILGVLLVGGSGVIWLQQTEISALADWPELPGFARKDKVEPPTQTLLEVVDAGKVYDRLVRKLAHASLGQLEASSRDRYKSLSSLQAEAAGPLIQQAQLFLALTNDGIKQSNRKDRETDRLQALASQGAVLEVELKRLELAWFSLSSGTDWRDLGKLSDDGVSARRDSLGKRNAHSLTSAGQELGTSDLVPRVAAANEEAVGMADLLRLFQAEAWSRQWEKDLPQAAGKVSPSASKITRAYRNSAYTLVRLKEAERSTLADDMAFSDKFGTEAWFPFDVVELLPSLRRQINRFPGGDAPAILDGTLAIHAVLQQSAKGEYPGSSNSAELVELEANEALQFDPEVYGDLVERVRFEAARHKIAQGENPDDLADVYFVGGDRETNLAFMSSLDEDHNEEYWQALADSANRPFFRRWARANSSQSAEKKLELLAGFGADWENLKALRSGVSRLAMEGQDWTAGWHDLRDQVQSMQEKYPSSWAKGNWDLARKIQILQTMSLRLDYQGQLAVTGVVVRLGSEFDDSDKSVVIHMSKSDGSPVGQPLTLQLGPAAPVGSGWVGAGSLDWQFTLACDEALLVSVNDAATGDVLQEYTYESLGQRVGCGALTRTQNLDGGSLNFKTSSLYWQGLVLPEIP
jgi:hypothetical protein